MNPPRIKDGQALRGKVIGINMRKLWKSGTALPTPDKPYSSVEFPFLCGEIGGSESVTIDIEGEFKLGQEFFLIIKSSACDCIKLSTVEKELDGKLC